MILKLFVSGLVLIGAFFTVNQDPKPAPAPQDEKAAAPAGQDEEMAKMMAMYEKAAIPGAEHKGLATLVGKWEQKCSFSMGGPPTESTGTSEYKSIHGGRFVLGENSTKMMMPGPDGKVVEKPFNGFNLMGYDNTLKQYQSCWCDSFGTGMFMSTGTADKTGKIITYEGTMKDAMTPKGRPWKMVINIESDDKHLIELWDAFDGTNLVKMGTITETRKK